MRERWIAWTTFPRAVVTALVLAGILTLPGLAMGFFNDDVMQVTALDRQSSIAWSSAIRPMRGPFELYTFSSGEPDDVSAAIWQGGLVAWWTHPQWKIRLARPLSSLLLTLDHSLFGHHPLGYHIHSWLWYLALVGAVAILFRRIAPWPAGALAAIIFAIDDGHMMPAAWTASRHAVIALVPCVLGLLAHVRFPSRRWLAVGGFAIGLLASENAVAMLAYPIAYELFAEPRRRRHWTDRARGAAPFFGLAAVYFAIYRALGYGVRSSGAYVEPFADPIRYAERAATRLPVLLYDLLGGISTDLWMMLPPTRVAIMVGGVIFTTLVVLAFRSILPSIPEEERATLRWMAIAAFASILPGAAGLMGSRVLIAPSLGVAFVVATFIVHTTRAQVAARRPLIVRFMRVSFVLAHLIVAPLALAGSLVQLCVIAHSVDVIARDAEVDTTMRDRNFPAIIVLTAHDPLVALYVPNNYALMPNHEYSSWHVLSMAPHEHRLTRTAAQSIELAVIDGAMLTTEFEELFRPPTARFTVGDAVSLPGARLRVVAIDRAGRPTRIDLTTENPIDGSSYRFLTWKSGGLRAVVLPQVGESIVLASEPGPVTP